jgi:methyl coenzyme M reductase subunit C
MGRNPTTNIIWIIDNEQWPRAYLRAELLERGYVPISFEKLSVALSELRRAITDKPQIIVLELRGQKITTHALELMAGVKVPMIAIGGMLELNNPMIKDFKWAELLRRPVTIGMIANAVEKIVHQTHKAGASD